MLPNCFVIGAAKCGTTSLHDYLDHHPDIAMSVEKEPAYFSSRWSDDRDWYEALFAAAGTVRIRGESSPNYSKNTEYPETPRRIAAAVPDARLIYLIRDPIERIRSQYEHNRTAPRPDATRPIERRSFSVAIRDDHRYADGSRYAFQIDRYLEHFDRAQLLVLSSEQLRTDRRAVLRQVFTFLDVDPDFWDPSYDVELHRSGDRVTSPRGDQVVGALRGSPVRRIVPRAARTWIKGRLRHPRQGAVTVSDTDAAWLWEQLNPDVQRLRAHVGPEFDLWDRA